MATVARGIPRFLPTLTEVVRVPPVPVVPPPDLAALEAARRLAFAQRIRAQVQDSLDARIHDAVADAMLEQVDRIGEQLRRQMDDMVRGALEAVAARLHGELVDMMDQAVDDAIAAPDTQADAAAGGGHDAGQEAGQAMRQDAPLRDTARTGAATAASSGSAAGSPIDRLATPPA